MFSSIATVYRVTTCRARLSSRSVPSAAIRARAQPHSKRDGVHFCPRRSRPVARVVAPRRAPRLQRARAAHVTSTVRAPSALFGARHASPLARPRAAQRALRVSAASEEDLEKTLGSSNETFGVKAEAAVERVSEVVGLGRDRKILRRHRRAGRGDDLPHELALRRGRAQRALRGVTEDHRGCVVPVQRPAVAHVLAAERVATENRG